MKILVNIQEVVSETFEIESNSVEEALEIAREKYDNGEIVLEPGELISTSASAYDEKIGEWSEAVEFWYGISNS